MHNLIIENCNLQSEFCLIKQDSEKISLCVGIPWAVTQLEKTYIHWLSQKLMSLGIMRGLVKGNLKLPNTILLRWAGAFRGGSEFTHYDAERF